MYESDVGSASLVLHHAVGSQLIDGAVQEQWVSKYDVRAGTKRIDCCSVNVGPLRGQSASA